MERDQILQWLLDNPGEHATRDIYYDSGASEDMRYQAVAGDLRKLLGMGLVNRRKQLADEVAQPSGLHRSRGWRYVYAAVTP